MSPAVSADEKRSVESPEAFKKVCDEAMPDLLKMNARGVVPFREVCNDACCDALVSNIEKLSAAQKDLGTPVGWTYLGVRKLGSMLRQYVYVSRYALGPVFWQFTAFERGGRWTSGQFYMKSGQNIWSVFALVPRDRRFDNAECAVIGERILDFMKTGKGDAAEIVKRDCLRTEPAMVEEWGEALKKAHGFVTYLGGALSSEMVATSGVGDVLAARLYHVRCADNALTVTMTFYRPAKDWKAWSVSLALTSIGSNNADDLAGEPIEPDDSSNAVKTVTRPMPMPEPTARKSTTAR
jgi:hypothetical protein